MDLVFLILGILFLMAGWVGCVLPVLPGPPLGYVALLFLHWSRWGDFSPSFLLWSAVAAVVVTLLDYVVPIWGTKRFGGSKAGVWGATLGLLVGLFFGLPGIILGPFLGAYLGEVLNSSDSNHAFKAAFGSFVGLLTGVLLKLVVTGVFTWYFFVEWLA